MPEPPAGLGVAASDSLAVQSGDEAGERLRPEACAAVIDEASLRHGAARGQTQRLDEWGASVLAEASPAVARGPAEAAPVPLALPRAQHHWPTKVFGRPLLRCWMRPSQMFRSAALPLTDHSSRDSTGQPALGALKAFMSLTEAPAGYFTRCPLNLNSHNHNQHDGSPCFYLAILRRQLTSPYRSILYLL